jgi:hypothetical protein
MIPYNIKFEKSNRKGKKYKVSFKLEGDKDDKTYIRHFGSIEHMHYMDKTPLKLYSGQNWEHKDKERRVKYYLRHGVTNSPLSAKYWANFYLW